MPVSKAVKEAVKKRANGLCEDCHTRGDFRGLMFHEEPFKGMGGTKRVYTESEVWRLCGRCHNARHSIFEEK